jgi:hypothetical protein
MSVAVQADLATTMQDIKSERAAQLPAEDIVHMLASDGVQGARNGHLSSSARSAEQGGASKIADIRL